MSADNTQVKVTLTLDSRQYEQALKSASKHTSAVDASMAKTQKTSGMVQAGWVAMGAAVTMMGAKAVAAMGDCVRAASDLSESASKMRVIFGAAAADIVAFAADSADKLGMTTQAAYDAASMMATFGKAAGLTGRDLSKFSTDMVNLSADLGSFFNTDTADAMDAIGAALRGEAEPIRRYGVLLDDATLKSRAMEMGIISTVKNALTPQQRALAAQAEILAQTSDAQGDFARTGDGLANSQKKLSAELGNLKASIGDTLLPMFTKGVQGAAALAKAFGDLPSPVRDGLAIVMAGLAGLAVTAPAITGAVKGIGKVREALAGMQKTALGAKAAQAGASVSTMVAGMGGIGPAALSVLGPLGLAAAAVGGLAFAGTQLANANIDKRVAAIGTAMTDARIAGQHLDSALKVTFSEVAAAATQASTDVAMALYSAPSGMGASGPTSFFGMDSNMVTRTVTSLRDVVDVAKGSGFAAREAKGQLAAMDAQLTSMSTDAAAIEWQHLKDAMTGAGGSVEDLNALMPGYVGQLKEAAAAAADAENAQDGYRLSTQEMESAVKSATQAIFGLIAARLAAEGSADALVGAEDRLRVSVEKGSSSLDKKSKAGLANREALRQEVAAIATYAQAQSDKATADGRGAEAADIARTKIEKGRQALIDHAVAAGMDAKEVEGYVNRLLEVPPKTETELKADYTDAVSKIEAIKAKLKDPALTDPERTKLTADMSQLEAVVEKARTKLGTVQDVQATIRARIVADIRAMRWNQTGGGGGGGGGSAVARAMSTTHNTPGMCGATVGNWLGGRGPHGPTAIAAWNNAPASVKHPGDWSPPAGVPVYFRGGRSGHVALSLGDGRIRSTDWPSSGRTGTTSIGELAAAWGKTYVGWAKPFARGGKVRGPGTSTSDSIPALLSDREWVIPALVGDRLGDEFMSAMVDGSLAGFASGGKAKSKAKKKPTAAEIVDDIEWQFDMGKIDLPAKLALLEQQLAKMKAGSAGWKDLALTIHQVQQDIADASADQLRTAEEKAELERQAAEEKADIERQAAEEQAKAAQAVIDAARQQRDSYASSVAQGMIGSLALGQSAAGGKKWSVQSMLGDFANRAKSATDFGSMIQSLTSRGLSEDVISQVVAAGPQAGADMARTLMRMSTEQLATVNASQNSIRGAAAGMGGFLANAFYGVPGDAGTMTITLGGGAPVVLQLDSRQVYEGQLELQRQMGGSYALVPR